MNIFFLRHKGLIEMLIERKLKKMVSNPKRKRKTRKAAKTLLQVMRRLSPTPYFPYF